MLPHREMPGWDQAGYDASSWHAVDIEPHEAAVAFQPYPCEQIIAVDTVRPLAVTEPTPGAYVFDMGQCFAGIATLKVQSTRTSSCAGQGQQPT